MDLIASLELGAATLVDAAGIDLGVSEAGSSSHGARHLDLSIRVTLEVSVPAPNILEGDFVVPHPV